MRQIAVGSPTGVPGTDPPVIAVSQVQPSPVVEVCQPSTNCPALLRANTPRYPSASATAAGALTRFDGLPGTEAKPPQAPEPPDCWTS